MFAPCCGCELPKKNLWKYSQGLDTHGQLPLLHLAVSWHEGAGASGLSGRMRLVGLQGWNSRNSIPLAKKKKTWLFSPQGKQFEPWTCTNPTLMILGSQNLGPRPESINHLAGQCWHMCSRKGNLLTQNAATYFTGIIGTLHIFVAFCCYVFVANAPMPIIPQTSASRHPFGCSGPNCRAAGHNVRSLLQQFSGTSANEANEANDQLMLAT